MLNALPSTKCASRPPASRMVKSSPRRELLFHHVAHAVPVGRSSGQPGASSAPAGARAQPADCARPTGRTPSARVAWPASARPIRSVGHGEQGRGRTGLARCRASQSPWSARTRRWRGHPCRTRRTPRGMERSVPAARPSPNRIERLPARPPRALGLRPCCRDAPRCAPARVRGGNPTSSGCVLGSGSRRPSSLPASIVLLGRCRVAGVDAHACRLVGHFPLLVEARSAARLPRVTQYAITISSSFTAFEQSPSNPYDMAIARCAAALAAGVGAPSMRRWKISRGFGRLALGVEARCRTVAVGAGAGRRTLRGQHHRRHSKRKHDHRTKQGVSGHCHSDGVGKAVKTGHRLTSGAPDNYYILALFTASIQ